MRALFSRIRRRLRRGGGDGFDALDRYEKAAPDPQNALDIFKGVWASHLPPPWTELKAGPTALFEDQRIRWAIAQLGGVSERTILDLGPLEGGHPYMFESMGARRILAIEGNRAAFLRCLVTKELLGLKRVAYLCGDFVPYLRQNQERFDVVNASGVLYHQSNPAELLGRIAQRTDRVIIWTHYYDRERLSVNPSVAHKTFTPERELEYEGFRFRPYRQEYGAALRYGYFCGGNAPFSHWMTRDDIVRCLHHFGLNDVRTSFDHPLHPNGPSLNLVAERTAGPASLRHDSSHDPSIEG